MHHIPGISICGPLLCSLIIEGAEVIKIERLNKGDDTRGWGPPWTLDNSKDIGVKTSTYFASTNRNKKSITIDISKQRGQELVTQLAMKSDILVENYKVHDLKRYRLDYKSLSQFHPGLIYCSITGYGQEGPSNYMLLYVSNL